MMGQDQGWASGRGLNNVVGPRREFTRRFAEGIEKLTGNTPGDRRKKTVRLAARMLKAIGLAGVEGTNFLGIPTTKPPVSGGYTARTLDSGYFRWLTYPGLQLNLSYLDFFWYV
ncbi:hypothetical protein BHM03_00007733 [Ensete ventricosum]|uniref:Uncharacterized protein n=1 Tax=Ensete ventricosum TaxID=4639 RepID=A0A445MC97_ENSVE|nr:hypothetical protein BHM03_00007733 [Ensete ventricosum]